MAAPTEQEPIERVVERTRDSIQRAQLRSQEEAAQTQFATTHAVRMPWPDAERLCAAASKAAEAERAEDIEGAVGVLYELTRNGWPDDAGALRIEQLLVGLCNNSLEAGRQRGQKQSADYSAALDSAREQIEAVTVDRRELFNACEIQLAELRAERDAAQAEVAQLRAELERSQEEREIVHGHLSSEQDKSFELIEENKQLRAERAEDFERQLRARVQHDVTEQVRSVSRQLGQEMEQLRAERDAEREHVGKLTRELDAKDRELSRRDDKIESLRIKLAAAEAALRPFATIQIHSSVPDSWSAVNVLKEITVGDLRAARAALAGEGE